MKGCMSRLSGDERHEGVAIKSIGGVLSSQTSTFCSFSSLKDSDELRRMNFPQDPLTSTENSLGAKSRADN